MNEPPVELWVICQNDGDVRAKWPVPSTSNVPVISVGKMKLGHKSEKQYSVMTPVPSMTNSEIFAMLSKIHYSGDDAALMGVVEPFAPQKYGSSKYCQPYISSTKRKMRGSPIVICAI